MLGLPCQITKEAETHTPGLVFVDSFRSVSLAAEGTTYSTLQRFIQSLGVRLTGWQVTTFLIGEYCNENDPNPIFTIADGLIWLTHSAYKNSVVR